MFRQLYQFLHPRFQSIFLEYPIDFKPRYGFGNPPHKALYTLIDAERLKYSELLHKVLDFAPVFYEIKKQENETDPLKPVFNNGYFPGLDMVILYTLIATHKPHTYYEIGSGNSTKMAYKSIKDNGLNTKIVSVDPKPRAEIDSMADKVIRKPFECADLDEILALKENDILFIDNSHRIAPNSDSMVFYMEVLPHLKKGVLVHLHDIYLPYDYPQFMCNRFYSEQYGLAINLLANTKKFTTFCPNYFISKDPELKMILKSMWSHPNLQGVEQHGGSFWMKINI